MTSTATAAQADYIHSLRTDLLRKAATDISADLGRVGCELDNDPTLDEPFDPFGPVTLRTAEEERANRLHDVTMAAAKATDAARDALHLALIKANLDREYFAHADALTAAQIEVRQAETELFEARLRRAVAIRAANDAGMTKYRISKILGLSQPAITTELARTDLPADL